jgi:filamentous hemagglutinin
MDNIMDTTKISVWKRVTAGITLFFMMFSITAPAIANTLLASEIESQLRYSPELIFTSNGQYQYEALPQLNTSTQLGFFSAENFYAQISSGADTNKYVGTPFAQVRIIRSQVYKLLGRQLIDSSRSGFATEASQIQSLYDNAVLFKNTGHSFGEVLTISRESAPYDMIWPELRRIHGEQVIVPVLYLTASTVQERKIQGTTAEFGGDVNFGSLNIADVDIKFGRNSFVNLSGDFNATNSQIESSGDLKLLAGGDVSLMSTLINASGDISIGASSIQMGTIVHRYDLSGNTGTNYGQLTTITSETGDVVLRSYGNIIVEGSLVSANEGAITFAADGSIYIGPIPISSSFEGYEGGWYVDRSDLTYLTSSLSAQDTIKLMASGQITLDAVDIVSSQGGIELLAGLGITILDSMGQHQETAHGRFGKKTIDTSVYQTVAIRSLLDAGKGIKLSSEFGDINLRAVDITSAEGTQVKATNGGVNLLMTTETDHYSYSSIKKDLFTIKTKSYGHNIETGVPNTVVGGFSVEALSGVTVEYTGDPELSVTEQIDVLNGLEGLSWMAQLRDENSAEFSEVLLLDDSWYESDTTLSPAAIAVITIAVAVAAGPAAGSISSTVGGASTAAAVGSTAAAGLGAAAGAAFTSLVSTAVVSLANGNSLESTLKSLSSKDNLRSLAISMVTAGAIASVDDAFFTLDTDAIDTAVAAGGTQVAVDASINTATQTLQSQLVQALTHSAIQASVQTIANGGDVDDFGDGFVQALAQAAINRLGEELANEIGVAKHNDQIDTALQFVAHAGVGCLTGTLTTKVSGGSSNLGCYSGAGGAVVGEAIGQAYEAALEGDLKEWMREQTAEGNIINQDAVMAQAYAFKAQGVDMAKLSAALTAFVLGGDVNIAASTGANAAENNALLLITLIATAAYTSYVSYQEGGLYEALQAFGTGEHPLAEAMNSVTEQAVEWAASEFPEETKELAGILGAVGNTVAAGVQVVMETSTGETVTRYWNELSPQDQNAIIGGLGLISVIVPAGVVTKLKTLSSLPPEIELNDWVSDPNSPNWDKVSPEQKEVLLSPVQLVSIDDLPIQPSRDLPNWSGSGPESGVLGVNPLSTSTYALRNFVTNNGGVEFVFDPTTSTFLVRGQNYPGQHSLLAESINAPTDQVVGGILTKSNNGTFITNESSGHFWQNWTPELRENFVDTMSKYGLDVSHSEGM